MGALVLSHVSQQSQGHCTLPGALCPPQHGFTHPCSPWTGIVVIIWHAAQICCPSPDLR